jgi:iron complex transport system substrate-binding protein
MNCNPRVPLPLAALACCLAIPLLASCDSRHDSQPAQTASTAPSAAAASTVASLAPAATDLIVGMGAADHLVAVSNFDFDRPNVPKLPRVGDYQNTDWERLDDLKPGIIIVQMEPSRIPAGFSERASAIGAKIVDIKIEQLSDIDSTLGQLGDALHEQSKAADARAKLRARLNAVRMRVANQAAVPTLLALDDSGASAAGPGTFLDEILTIAGGRNVLAGTTEHWPSLDRERLIALSPSAVVELLPGASPQVLARAADFWKSVPEIPAVRDGRTYQINDPWVLTPGIEVADLAEHIASVLHPAVRP